MAKRKPAPIVRISSTQSALRVPRKKLAKLIEFTSEQEGATLAELDLAVVAENEMADLNYDYLRHSGATDVLSFDLSDAAEGKIGICAQLVICGEVAVRQGRAHGLTPQRELMLYVVHGLLHLMGYEDKSIRGAARMHAREDEILDAFTKRS